MAVYIGHEAFSGPMESPDQLVDRAGLYAVLIRPGRGQVLLCLDQSANVNSAVTRRIRAGEFSGAEAPLQFAVLYTPGVQAAGRKRMLESLRTRLED